MDDHTGLLAGGTILFTIVIIIFSLVVTIVPIVLILRFVMKMKQNNDQILMTGVPAQARVTHISPTGMTINDAPQLNIGLEVHPPQGGGYRGAPMPFMAQVQALVPIYAMARIQPGAMVAVRFDPANPARVAIDFRSMGFG
ncbi:MAG: hypothetical protein JST00_10400 [Deltaproteobacteria bacterium]|nr:hypothetical protein [Deltaproteobacteria bacterium]